MPPASTTPHSTLDSPGRLGTGSQAGEDRPIPPVARYLGQYNDPWYGTITVRQDKGLLAIDFPHSPGMTATLQHHQYEQEQAATVSLLDLAAPGIIGEDQDRQIAA